MSVMGLLYRPVANRVAETPRIEAKLLHRQSEISAKSFGEERGSDKRLFFFFNDPAPTEIYPLSLLVSLPISPAMHHRGYSGRIEQVLFGPARGPSGSAETTPNSASPAGSACSGCSPR